MNKTKIILNIIAILCSIACFIFAIIDGNYLAVLGWLVAALNETAIISYELSGGGK